MAHFSELNTENIVTRVLATNNNDPEEGYLFLQENFGGVWVKTSYNTYGGVHSLGGEPFRKNFGRVGYLFDFDRDAFIPPKPFDSWSLNEESYLWQPPVAYPTDDKFYTWSEDDLNWKEVINA